MWGGSSEGFFDLTRNARLLMASWAHIHLNVGHNKVRYLYLEALFTISIGAVQLVDDVEFWFPPGNRSIVEYRSASRFGQSDFDANRKRIRVR
jgi:uncharacterized protein (DUF1499 family)